MKKILLFVYLCLLCPLAYSKGLGVHFAGLFAPPPAPCSVSAPAQTAQIQQATVTFYCGIDTAQQDLILHLVGKALDSMPPGMVSRVQVFAFTDLDQGVAAEYNFLKGQGYSPSLPYLHSAWLDNGFLGQTFKGGVFLYSGNSAWRRDPSLAALTVLHEMHHIVQYQLMGPGMQGPVWLLEGGAEDFANSQLIDLGYSAPARDALEYRCNYPLAQLENDDHELPLGCRYLEGARAVRLLLDAYGQQAYYRLFREIGMHDSFSSAFKSVYGYPLARFYTGFEEYRESGYTVRPMLAVSPHLP